MGTVVSRIITISLLLLSATDLAGPFLIQDTQSALPACCRRDGKHHCAMMDMLEADTDDSPKAVPSRCASFPKHGVAASLSASAAPAPVQAVAGLVFTHPEDKAQAEALYRISYARSRQERGPPLLS
jgi:hypothetical protein